MTRVGWKFPQKHDELVWMRDENVDKVVVGLREVCERVCFDGRSRAGSLDLTSEGICLRFKIDYDGMTTDSTRSDSTHFPPHRLA